MGNDGSPSVRRATITLLVVGLALVAVAIGIALASRTPEAVIDPAFARGAELYAANCVSCHGGATGGRMMDYPPRHNASGHTWHHPDCQLEETVRDGAGEMGEMMRRMMNISSDVPRMPAFRDRLTDEEIDAILAFIRTWWTEGQRAYQAGITRQTC